MAQVSFATGRQVGVIADRRGSVEFVVVGDANKLFLPDIGRARASEGRFRGLRLLHTHLDHEGLTRDDLVDLTRLRLDLVLAICLGPGGEPSAVHYGHNVPVPPGSTEPPYRAVGPLAYSVLIGDPHAVDPSLLIASLEAEYARAGRVRDVDAKDGRAILVHVCEKRDAWRAEESLRELAELARTAGVEVIDEVLQVRERIDPKFVMGRGKLEEILLRSMQSDATVLIFDRNLGSAQAAAIAKVTDLKVIDRTQLILDIFAQRAESRDGKLQVELAQMKYLLPRLGQKDDSLSRLTGGIGGRGPGETVLEIGKRRARERISRLESELEKLAVQRRNRRQLRRRREVPIVSIVGYTNAGKSTLLNALTASDTVAEDKLFATLDTRARRLRFPGPREVVVTDTVGFIRDLPPDLFAAFRATFEEAQDADLLLHVVDASDPAMGEHMKTTNALLSELGLANVPTLIVLNKTDRMDSAEVLAIARAHDGVPISALDPRSFEPMLARMQSMLFDPHVVRSDEFELGAMEPASATREGPYFDDAAIDELIRETGTVRGR